MMRNVVRATRIFHTGNLRGYSSWANTDPQWHATTILSIRRGNKIVMIGDGQVTHGHTILKPTAKKVRKLDNNILTGFAGSTADAITLLERLQRKLEEYPGQLRRSCVSLAQDWRGEHGPKLEAMMIVADKKETFLLTGNGDVLEPPNHGVIAVGSGGNYAASAAIALLETNWDAERIALKVKIFLFFILSILSDLFTRNLINFRQ